MIAEGAFVKVLFPTREMPRRPGLLHICYCLAIRRPLALFAYSTSAEWPNSVPLPFGVKLFTQQEAMGLNQTRAFRLHLNRQARIPLAEAWIPELNTPSNGVIALVSTRVRQELYETTLELEKRHAQNIERLGI